MSLEKIEKPKELDISTATELIRANFPVFSDVKLIEEKEPLQGADNFAFRSTNGYFFRFAKSKEASEANLKEKRLLPVLANSLSVQIPNPQYSAEQPNGNLFVGYRAIEGTSLTKEAIERMGHNEKGALIASMARFLNELRSFPIEEAYRAGVEDRDQKKFASRIWGKYLELKQNPFNESEKGQLDSIFREFLTNENNFNYKPVLVHADLGPGHIFFNEAEMRISGVIDWSDIVVTDPAFEIEDLYQNYGVEFTRAVLETIGTNADQELMRAKFYTIARNLQRYMNRLRDGQNQRAEKNLERVRMELSGL